MRARTEGRHLNWRGGLDLIASVSMIAVAAMLVLGGGPFGAGPQRGNASPRLPVDPVSLDGLAIMGSRQAPFGMIVYSDFQCPFCRRFALEVLPDVETRLIDPGQLAVAFKHLPLESIHPFAMLAAGLAECSRPAGRFWDVHDSLFAEPALSLAVIESVASRHDLAGQSACWTGDGRKIAEQQGAQAVELGITGTPTFLIGPLLGNGRLDVKKVLSGFQSAEAIASAVTALAPGGD